jgi:hypothetical protein
VQAIQDAPAGAVTTPQTAATANTDAGPDKADKSRTAKRPSVGEKNYGPENEAVADVVQIFDHILAGDEELMADTWQQLQGCRFSEYRNLEDMIASLDKLRQSLTRDFAGNPEMTPERIEERVDAARYGYLQTLNSCAWQHQPGAAGIRDKVAALAQGGDVIARFLYAMLLSPSPWEMHYIQQHAAWTTNALNFTLQNVADKQTLGAAAMYRSYLTGLFTPQNIVLSQAWQLVLLSCPKNGPNPLWEGARLELSDTSNISDIAAIHAQNLVREQCPDSALFIQP